MSEDTTPKHKKYEIIMALLLLQEQLMQLFGISSFVCGFLQVRVALSLVSNVPNPTNCTFSLFSSSFVMILMKLFKAFSKSFFERPVWLCHSTN